MTLKKDSYKRIQTIWLYFTLFLEGKLFRFLASHCIRCLSLTVLVETATPYCHLFTRLAPSFATHRQRGALLCLTQMFPYVRLSSLVLHPLIKVIRITWTSGIVSVLQCIFFFNLPPFFQVKEEKRLDSTQQKTLCVFWFVINSETRQVHLKTRE